MVIAAAHFYCTIFDKIAPTCRQLDPAEKRKEQRIPLEGSLWWLTHEGKGKELRDIKKRK
jgi:hypothetical protein